MEKKTIRFRCALEQWSAELNCIYWMNLAFKENERFKRAKDALYSLNQYIFFDRLVSIILD